MRQKISIKELSSQAIQEYHKSLIALLEKVPANTFNVVELKPSTLKVQPNAFLNDGDLFKEIQQASLSWEKLSLDDEGNPRIKRGWVFEWVWSHDLLLKLMSCKGVRLVQPDRIIQAEPFHFIKEESLWVGLCLGQFPEGLPAYSMHDWQLTHHEKEKVWYWVCQAETLLMDWFKLKVKNSLFVNPLTRRLNPNKILAHLEVLGLVKWFREWLDTQLSARTVIPESTSIPCWKVENWVHPSDEWFAFYDLSPEIHGDLHKLVGGDAPALALTLAREMITNLKEQAAFSARQEKRKTALADAMSKLQTRAWTKPEILQLASDFDVKVKKSDSKPKLIEVLLASERGQEIANQVVGIPADPTI